MVTFPTSSLSKLAEQFAASRYDYYAQWMFDDPIILSAQEDQDLQFLQKIIRKLIRAFALDYKQWRHLMPLSPASERIVLRMNTQAYRCGSYRVDTVFDQNWQYKIIETTCRFALNGYFTGNFAYHFACVYQRGKENTSLFRDRFCDFFPYLMSLIGNHQKIIVLKRRNSKNSSMYFVPIFQKMGFEVLIIAPEEIERRQTEIVNGFVISELAIEDIEGLSDAVLERLMEMEVINDFRTVILAHDKRFYDVMGQPDFRAATLTEEEITHLDKFYVPTYRFGNTPQRWEQARLSKDDWILKHRALGKSQDIYAGAVTQNDQWQELFKRKDIDQFVLQQWVEQPRLTGTVNGVEHHDYITGTLLFFDDNYFGPGIFRSSSFPVLNKVDDRKFFSLTLK